MNNHESASIIQEGIQKQTTHRQIQEKKLTPYKHIYYTVCGQGQGCRNCGASSHPDFIQSYVRVFENVCLTFLTIRINAVNPFNP